MEKIKGVQKDKKYGDISKRNLSGVSQGKAFGKEDRDKLNKKKGLTEHR